MKVKNILATASAAVLVLGVSVNAFAGEGCATKKVSENRTPAANTVVASDVESPQQNYISSRLER